MTLYDRMKYQDSNLRISSLFLYILIINSLVFFTTSTNNEDNSLSILPMENEKKEGESFSPIRTFSSSTSSSSSVSSLSSSSSSSSSLLPSSSSSSVASPRQLSCVQVNVSSPTAYQVYPTGFVQRVRWSAGCYMPSDLIDIELFYHDDNLNMDAFVSTLVSGWNATQGYWDWPVPDAVPIAGADSFQFKIVFYVSPGGHSNRAVGKSPIFIIAKYIPPRYPYAEVAGITLGALTVFSCILCFLAWRCCKPGCCYYPVVGKTREFIKRKLQERKQRKLAAKKRIEAEIERKKHEALLAEAAKLSFGLWGTPAYVEPRLPPKRIIFPPVTQADDINNADEEDRIIIGFTEDGQPKFGTNSQHNKKRNKKGVKRGRGGRNRSTNNGRDYVQANNGSSDEEPPRTEAEAQAKAARMRVEAARRLSANGYPTNENSDSADVDEQPMIMIDDQGLNTNNSDSSQKNEENELTSTSTFHGTANAPSMDNRPPNSSSSSRSIRNNKEANWASTPGRDRTVVGLGRNLPPLGNNSGFYESDHSDYSNQAYDNEGRNYNGSNGYHSNYDNLSQPSIDDELSSVGGRAIHLEYGTGERYDGNNTNINNQQQLQQSQQSYKSPASYPSSSSSTQGDSLDEHTQQYSYGSRKPSAGYYNNISVVNNNLNTSNRGILSPGSASSTRNVNSASNIQSTGRPPRSRPVPGPSDDFLRTALGPYDGDDHNPPVRGHITGYQSESGSLQSYDDNHEQNMIGVPDTSNNYSSGNISGRSSANRRNYSNNNSAYPSNENRYYSDHSSDGGGNESAASLSANNSPRPAFVRGHSGNSLPMPRGGLDTLNSGSTAGDAFLISTPNNTRPASGSYLLSSSHTSSFRSPPGTSGRSTAGKTGAAVIFS